MLVLKTVLAIIIMGVYLMSCDAKKFSTENPDPFFLKLLENGDPEELKAWLYDGKSVLGELQTNENSIALADAAYSAGAVQIFGIDIESHPQYGKGTGDLVIELPNSKTQREAVITWAAPIAWGQGFDAYSDVGQKYLYVKLD